jgi:hypothetical protein
VREWILTTALVAGTPYETEIAPITFPIFEAYAAQWDMKFEPHVATFAEMGEFRNGGGGSTSPAPRGTEVVYHSIPVRRAMLDRAPGVVFLDSDAVIMDFEYDICREVSENVPIAAGGAFNGAVVVMRSCDKTKEFLDIVWAKRDQYKHYQWLEQAAMMELMGINGRYPGDNTAPGLLGDGVTEWTPLWSHLSGRWNAHWGTPQTVRPLIFHPGGCQPFERRLAMVRDAVVDILPAPWRNDLPRI